MDVGQCPGIKGAAREEERVSEETPEASFRIGFLAPGKRIEMSLDPDYGEVCCPEHGTVMFWWPAGNKYACQDSTCRYARGVHLADLPGTARDEPKPHHRPRDDPYPDELDQLFCDECQSLCQDGRPCWCCHVNELVEQEMAAGE